MNPESLPDHRRDHAKPGRFLQAGCCWAIASLLTTLPTGCSRRAPETPVASQPAAPEPVTAAVAPAAAGGVPTYDLEFEAGALGTLEQSAYSNQTVPATFKYQGESYPVKVRYRGAWARSWPKKPLKIFFPKDKSFEKQHCLDLNSAWRDPAMVREALAYQVFRSAGVPASKCRMVRVNFNGQFRGLYVDVEQPDHAFLHENKLKGAAVYKAISRNNISDERDLGFDQAFAQAYEKQTRKSEGNSDLKQFCHDLATNPDIKAFFNQNVALDPYINYLAATALVQNWDGYNKNHFLVHDVQGSGKWFAVPWDLDRTFGDDWNWGFDQSQLSPVLGVQQRPGVTGWNRLQDRFFREPSFRARFYDRLAELLQTEFTEEKLFPVLDQLQAQLASEAALDRQRWPAPAPSLAQGIAQLKRYITARRAFLLQEIQRAKRG